MSDYYGYDYFIPDRNKRSEDAGWTDVGGHPGWSDAAMTNG